MKLLHTEIQIEASPETVWSILIDFEKYPEWNPFIISIKGNLQKGKMLETLMSPPNGKEMTFKPIIRSVVENSEFSWLGRFLFPGIFDGEHIFTLSKNENGCLLVQKEKFSGLLVPFLWKSLDQDTRAGFELMNQALKARAEKGNL